MDDTKIDFNPNANKEDASLCKDKTHGCTDKTATNFKPLANTDNGTCCPVPRGESADIDEYDTCLSEVIDFTPNWNNYYDDHVQFSTDDYRKAVFEVNNLKDTHKVMNTWVTVLEKMSVEVNFARDEAEIYKDELVALDIHACCADPTTCP